jgi:hypothetical protein
MVQGHVMMHFKIFCCGFVFCAVPCYASAMLCWTGLGCVGLDCFVSCSEAPAMFESCSVQAVKCRAVQCRAVLCRAVLCRAVQCRAIKKSHRA